MSNWTPSVVKYDVVPGFTGKVIGGEHDMIRRASSMYPKPPPRKWDISECTPKTKWDANSKSKITTLYLPHGELYNPMIHKKTPRRQNATSIGHNMELTGEDFQEFISPELLENGDGTID